MAERRIIKGWIVERRDDGTLVPIAPADQGAQMPVDPKFQYEGPKAGADLRGKEISNQVDAATAPYAGPTAAANAAAAAANAETARYGNPGQGYRWRRDPNGQLIMGADGQPMAEKIPGTKSPNDPPPQTVGNIMSVIDQINHIEALFNKHQKGVGLGSIAEYLPTQGNKAFDTAGAALGDMGTAAFKVPGLGSQSDQDAARFVAANQPSRWDTDSEVLEKLGALKRRVNNTLEAMGLPPAKWGAQYDPAGSDREGVDPAFLPKEGAPPIVLPDARGARGDNVRVSDEAGVTSAGKGLMREPRLAGVGQELLSMVQAGRPLNEVLAHGDKRFQEVGFPGVFPEQRRALEYATRMRAANPSKPVTNYVTGWENYEMVPDTQSGAGARAMGAAATWAPGDVPVGNTLTHFANAATAGVPTYLAGDSGADVMAASRRTMPVSSAIGDITGGLASMYGVNKLGGALIQTGTAPGQIAGRALTAKGGIGGDMAYGATRGGFENGPEGSVLGAIGGAVGNKVGSGLVNTTGRVIRGVSDPAVDYLSKRGIPLSTAQLLGNRGMVGKTMTMLESLPVIGPSMAARRGEAFEAYNRAALEDAGSRIGFTPDQTGFRGVEMGLDAAGGAIGDAVAGVDVPIDPTGRTDLANVIGNAQRVLTPDYAAKFATAIENRVAPAVRNGNLTGEAYQQAQRGVRRYQSGAAPDGFEQDFRDALGGVEDALTGIIDRQAGPQVSQNLANANKAYRDFSLIKSATEKAQAGSQSGTQEIFTPAQLQQAVRSSKYAKSGTNEPFYELNKAAQKILPSTVPNSGTADRGMASLLLPSLLGGSAVATSQYLDPKVAAPLAVLALLSTKTGAKVAQKALTGRGPTARAIGTKLVNQRRKAGLFGASAGVAMLPQFSQ